MIPHDVIFLTIRGAQSQFHREEEYFAFLGTSDSCYNHTQHSDHPRHISNNICAIELGNRPEVDCKHLFTAEKAGMGYILAINT